MIDKSQIDIVEVIGKYLTLKRAGSNYTAQCPFHPTNTFDAFRINPNKQIYRCFNCMDHAGDVIDFVMKIENVNFKRALEILELNSFSTPAAKPLPKEPDLIRDQSLLETAIKYFQFHLSESKTAQDYLKSRNITDETLISQLNIGYAPKYGLIKYLKNCGFSEKNILKEGLAKKGQYGVYDFFRERIIFPVYDIKKKIVTITSRAISKDAHIKHLHLSGEIRNFYNEPAITNSIVIITEGIFDCLSLLQSGFNAVAVFGTGGIKPEMALKINKQTKVFICFDRDANNAGQKGGIRAASIFEQMKMKNIYTVTLPIINGKKTDINDLYVNHGFTKDDMIELLKNTYALKTSA